MWGISGKPLKRAIWNTPGLLAGLTTCLRFSSVSDGACVACCLFLLTGSCHVLIQIYTTGCCFPGRPVLIRDDKVKWLDFGSTPDPVNLQPHPGYVWLKSGYSEAIPWRKVGLIKQRNVNLTTDGLWAMPLNEGWVPVKARRLCCAALKNVKPSPPNPYISETAFSCTFQKVYTYPPPGDDMFAHRSESCRKCRKVPKPRKLAGSECPREIYIYIYIYIYITTPLSP